MRDRFTRSLDSPDEVIEGELVRTEHVELGGVTVGRDTHQPGWRWSVHVRPLIGTEWCETRHIGFALGGRLRVLTRDGVEFDIVKGDTYVIPPGHDSWVAGDEEFVSVEWMGARTWLAPLSTMRERVLATLVFTDIVESTATARRIGDRAFADLVAVHDQRLTGTVARFKGEIVKLTGDGMLAMFDGAARAIRCARECDRAVSDLGLSLRAAVHTGEIEVAGDQIQGIAVNEAARILDLAEAHEVLVSATTAELAADSGLSFEDRGSHTLRGVGGERQLVALS
jgi:class 3 adenylate cyclase